MAVIGGRGSLAPPPSPSLSQPLSKPWMDAVLAKSSIWALLPSTGRSGVLESPTSLTTHLLNQGPSSVALSVALNEVGKP